MIVSVFIDVVIHESFITHAGAQAPNLVPIKFIIELKLKK